MIQVVFMFLGHFTTQSQEACTEFVNRCVVGSDRCEKKGNCHCHIFHTKKIGNKKVYGGKMSHSGLNII